MGERSNHLGGAMVAATAYYRVCRRRCAGARAANHEMSPTMAFVSSGSDERMVNVARAVSPGWTESNIAMSLGYTAQPAGAVTPSRTSETDSEPALVTASSSFRGSPG